MDKIIQNIPFLRLTVALASGVIIGSNYAANPIFNFAVLVVILLLIIYINRNYKFSSSLYFGSGIQIFFIFLGILITQQFNEKPVFYEKGTFVAKVLETPQEKPKSWKSLLQIEAVQNFDTIFSTNEKAIAYFAKNEEVEKLKAGDVILFNSKPQQIVKNNNPFEFDYKKYLAQRKIYRQVYLDADHWKNTGKSSFSVVCQAERIRENLLKIYREQPFGETEFEILSALTLGYKRELDPETKRIFSSSGAMHVLAVSGLHVGIIFVAFTFIFGFLRKYKTGKLVFVALTISTLWFYAFITGLSPSVMRASAMFTILIIGQNLNRKPNIYNSLAASAFLLLLINPNNLFDTGFQLSYSAVFGIAFLQPKLEKLLVVKNKFLNYFWQLITVSIAAQIATFPITTYYFGQFPTYFWITNTFVIPAVMFLVPFGILLLFISKIHLLSTILAILLNYTIRIIYFLLSAIEELPFSVIELPINSVQLIIIIVIVCAVLIFSANFKFLYVQTALIFTLMLCLSVLITEIKRFNHNELIVYNIPNNPSVHLIHRKKNYIISTEKITEDEMHYFPGIVTSRKMGLDPPVFLTVADTFSDKGVVLKNELLFFAGKTISLKKNVPSENNLQLPDFIINHANTEVSGYTENLKTTIISTKRFIEDKGTKTDKIHFLTLNGAFRKKW